MLIDNYMEFSEDILNGFQVIDLTQSSDEQCLKVNNQDSKHKYKSCCYCALCESLVKIS